MNSENLYNAGDVVNGRYEILKPAGSGGSGEVFEANDRQQRKHIAIKYLKSLAADRPETITQFKSEFATLTHLSHPHIAKVYDFEQDLKNKLFFFTSEYIEGHDFLKATRGMSVEGIEELFVQMLRALEYLHGNGVYHFDIKSANVLISECVKLIDFGLATIRFSGKLAGTPSYMAPEMIKRDSPDGRADLYSLGVLVYSALTGANPFRTKIGEDTLENQLKLVPPPPSSKNTDVPSYLDVIIMRLLEKRPYDRYQTAGQVISDFNLRSPKKYTIETTETQASYIPLESKFVGRTRELSILADLFEEKTPQLVIVRGANGTGKSRFLNEAKYLAQISEWTTCFLKEPSKATSWQKNVTKKQAQPMLVGIDDFQVMLGEVCGYKIEKTCESLAQRILANEQVILILAIDINSELPAKIKIPNTTTIELKNFEQSETKEYLTALTGLCDPPENIVGQIHTNTSGNPFILTEVTKSLVASGMLVDTQGRWKESTFEDIKINLDRLHIEPDLEKRLIKDFAELSNDAKAFTEMMAVISRPVTAHEANFISSPRFHNTVFVKLVRSGFARYDSIDGTYYFSRPLVAKTIYENMPDKIRKIWHDSIAMSLRGQRPKQSPANGDNEELLFHLTRGSNLESAKAALLKLIDMQTDGQKNFEAIVNTTFYLEKWNDPKAKLTLIKLYNRVGKYDLAITLANDVMENSEPEFEVEAQTSIGISCLRQMNFEAARSNFIAALQLASEMPMRKQLRIQNFLAEVSYFENNFDKALEIFERTDKMAATLSREDQLQIRNNKLGQTYFQKRDYKKAIQKLEKDLELYKDTEDDRLISRTQCTLAESYQMENQFDKAAERFNALIEHTKKVDDLEHLFRAYNGLGNLYYSHSKFKEAEEYYERALDIASRLQMDDRAITCIANLGIIKSNAGDLKKAFEYFSTVLAFIEGGRASSGLVKEYHGQIHLELGEIYRVNKNFDEANRNLDEALEIAKKTCNKELLHYTYLTLAKTAKDQGQLEASNAFFELSQKH